MPDNPIWRCPGCRIGSARSEWKPTEPDDDDDEATWIVCPECDRPFELLFDELSRSIGPIKSDED